MHVLFKILRLELMYEKEHFALVDLGIRVNLFYTISLNKTALISKSESVDNH